MRELAEVIGFIGWSAGIGFGASVACHKESTEAIRLLGWALFLSSLGSVLVEVSQ